MMSRHTLLLAIAATMLGASPAVAAIPQTGTGGAQRGTTTVVRSRCANCSTREDRRTREKLLLRIDSLRWEIENRRLTDTERARASRELNATVRALQQSLDESANGALAAAIAAEASVAEEAMGPTPFAIATGRPRARGYLGVTFDGPNTEIVRPGEYAVRWYTYPRIALVEPSSPAERAGVQQGDTLLAFNGTDVVGNEILLSKLLVPDAKIVMRLRRDGSSRDLKVTVGEAPEYYVRRQAPVVARAGRLIPMPPGVERVRVEPVPMTPPSPQQPQGAPMPAQPPVAPWIDYEGLAGARVETISEGLGKAVGVSEGVLVLRARPGTPAYRSGLRDGDVIVKAAGQTVSGVPALRNVLSMGDGDEGVRLVIIRERKERDVTLRW